MEYKIKDLKKGIKLHVINTDKFKTNLIGIFLTTDLNRENVTKNALISAVLRRGSKNMPTQEEISKHMEEMYGASFDCGLDKIGDNQVFKFYIETVNDNFLPNNDEKLLEQSIEKLLEIVFNPYLYNDSFCNEYIKQEKNTLKQIIEAKIDNKARYSLDRCIEEMYKDEPYGLYKMGYIEDLEKIDSKSLYEYYKELIANCKIEIFVSGIVDESIEKMLNANENISQLKDRDAKYIVPKMERKEKIEENVVTESMSVAQGKLVLGLDLDIDNEELKYDVMIYNTILGGSATSKMFQNVREKEHLAYVASSSYLSHKNNIFINCGIEIENYEKALRLVKEQIEDMRKGNFTDEDIENAKKGIISGIKAIDDEQDTGVIYYFGQELSQTEVTPDEYIRKIESVQKENIINIAKGVDINTIYFLKD